MSMSVVDDCFLSKNDVVNMTVVVDCFLSKNIIFLYSSATHLVLFTLGDKSTGYRCIQVGRGCCSYGVV